MNKKLVKKMVSMATSNLFWMIQRNTEKYRDEFSDNDYDRMSDLSLEALYMFDPMKEYTMKELEHIANMTQQLDTDVHDIVRPYILSELEKEA